MLRLDVQKQYAKCSIAEIDFALRLIYINFANLNKSDETKAHTSFHAALSGRSDDINR